MNGWLNVMSLFQLPTSPRDGHFEEDTTSVQMPHSNRLLHESSSNRQRITTTGELPGSMEALMTRGVQIPGSSGNPFSPPTVIRRTQSGTSSQLSNQQRMVLQRIVQQLQSVGAPQPAYHVTNQVAESPAPQSLLGCPRRLPSSSLQSPFGSPEAERRLVLENLVSQWLDCVRPNQTSNG